MAQCTFCNTAMEVAERYENDSRICDCPVCGKYILTDTAYESQLKCNQDDAILFSGVLRNRPDAERKEMIKSYDLNRIPEIVAPYRALSVTDKIENLIRYIAKNSKYLSDRVPIKKIIDYTKFYCHNHENTVKREEKRSFV